MGWQLRDPIGLWLQSDRTRSIYHLYTKGGQHKISLVVLHFPDKVSRPSVCKGSQIKCFIFILLPVIFILYIPLETDLYQFMDIVSPLSAVYLRQEHLNKLQLDAPEASCSSG